MEPKLYQQDPDFKMPEKWLSDEAYREAMEAFVIVCADVVFINRAKRTIFLATRRVKPQPGLWIIGGRIQAGESAILGMIRLVKRETSLELAPERFQFVAMNRYIFKDRQQEPQDRGSDNLAYTFAAELTPEERAIAASHLDPKEYDASFGLREFDLAALKALPAHQVILDTYAHLFS